MSPASLDVDRAKALTIVWESGTTSVYPLGFLRTWCPCAQCRIDREKRSKKPSSLPVLGGGKAFAGNGLRIEKAEMVGHYALRLEWSDGHGSGIYSFEYLREIAAGLK